uniref:Uncharacterized protein n=1 Tax=Zea mays TaxID=4577 RepID=B6TCG0_MAIZE|nr:hypothetical protein [Zea mays]
MSRCSGREKWGVGDVSRDPPCARTGHAVVKPSGISPRNQAATAVPRVAMVRIQCCAVAAARLRVT